jgi:outer membrane protein
MRKLLTSIFLVAFAACFGQEAVKALTLQECVKIALENNLRVRRGLYNLRGAEIDLNQSKLAMLPTLNAGSNAGKNFGRAINPVTNQFINRNATTLNLFGQASVVVFNGMRIQNTIKQNTLELEATTQDLEKAKNDVTLNVVTTYTNVVFNKELYANAKYQLLSSQEQLDRIKKQVAAGALPLASELNQEAQVATNEVNLINQENALNLSLLQLKQAMQVTGDSPLDVIVPPLNPEDLVLDQNPQEIYGISSQTMPEIKSANLRLRSADYGLKVAKAGYLPRLNLNGSMQTNYSDVSKLQELIDPAPQLSSQALGQTSGGQDVFAYQFQTRTVDYALRDQLNDNLFKSVSLSLTVPIFNNWQVKSSVQRAAVSKEVASITKLETENTLRQSIETAYNDALAASKTYSASNKQVQAREEAYRITKQRFEIGAANYVEFRIAENDLFQAKSDLARAKYNFIFRKKLLDFYQGKTIEF